ncbi:MAG: hypothetical protein JWM98_2715 [Thermoleophilia bacterium]|nr:hypothetical protein [Thermoleophilia bacterium]
MDTSSLEERIASLEARVAALEGARGDRPVPRRGASGGSSGGSSSGLDGAGWTEPYPVAPIEAAETWIELHELSARPQLQRLIRQVVEVEGPVTDRLVLDRVRRAWGLRRAGGRVAEAFDQAVRQLLARGLVERTEDALVEPGRVLHVVRVPGDDEATRRGAEEVPLVELSLALGLAARVRGETDEDELTMAVAKLLGWTRRGGAIQERLDAALAHAEAAGAIVRSGGRVLPVDAD